MTAPSGKFAGSGFRYCTVYALDGNGYPAAANTTVYEGIQAEGAKTLTLTEPEPRTINITGDDRLFAMDVLPALEGMRGELSIARANLELDAALRGLKVLTVGEAKGLLGGVTDMSGFEPQVGMLAYRQALDENGARVWECRVLPRAVLVPRDPGFAEADTPFTFSVLPQIVTRHLWGTAFTADVEGAVQAQVIRFVTQYKPHIVAWKADGSTNKFTFAAARQAVSTDKIHGVWVNGVLDTDPTLGTDGVTPTPTPANGDMVVCFYEVA